MTSELAIVNGELPIAADDTQEEPAYSLFLQEPQLLAALLAPFSRKISNIEKVVAAFISTSAICAPHEITARPKEEGRSAFPLYFKSLRQAVSAPDQRSGLFLEYGYEPSADGGDSLPGMSPAVPRSPRSTSFSTWKKVETISILSSLIQQQVLEGLRDRDMLIMKQEEEGAGGQQESGKKSSRDQKPMEPIRVALRALEEGIRLEEKDFCFNLIQWFSEERPLVSMRSAAVDRFYQRRFNQTARSNERSAIVYYTLATGNVFFMEKFLSHKFRDQQEDSRSEGNGDNKKEDTAGGEKRADKNLSLLRVDDVVADFGSSLCLAAAMDDTLMGKMLVEKYKASFSASVKDSSDPNLFGSRPLHLAIRHENLQLTQALVAAGDTCEDVEPYHLLPPMLWPVKPSSSTLVLFDYFINELKVDPSKATIPEDSSFHSEEERGQTLLHGLAKSAAVGRREVETVAIADLLLSAGVDVNHRDIDGKTVLHYVALHNQISLGEFLVTGGGGEGDARYTKASTCMVDEEGSTPMDIANKFGHVDLLKVLEKAAHAEAKPTAAAVTEQQDQGEEKEITGEDGKEIEKVQEKADDDEGDEKEKAEEQGKNPDSSEAKDDSPKSPPKAKPGPKAKPAPKRKPSESDEPQ